MNVDQSLKAVVASEEARQVSKFQQKLAERERKRQLKRTSSSSSQSIVAIDPLQENLLHKSPLASLLASCRSSQLITESTDATEIAGQLSRLLEGFSGKSESQQDQCESVRLLCQKVGLDTVKEEDLRSIRQAMFDEHGKVDANSIAKLFAQPHASSLPAPGRSTSGTKLAALSGKPATDSESAGQRFGNSGRRLSKQPGAEAGLNGITHKKLDSPPTASGLDDSRVHEHTGVVSREHSVEEAIVRNLSIETEGPLLSAENSLVIHDVQTPVGDHYPLDFTHYSSPETSPSHHPAGGREPHFGAGSSPQHARDALHSGSSPRRSDVPLSLLSPRAAARDLLNVDLETWLLMGSVDQIISGKRSALRLGPAGSTGKAGAVIADKYRQGHQASQRGQGGGKEWLKGPGRLEVGSAGAAMRKSLDRLQRDGGKAMYSPPNPLHQVGDDHGRRPVRGYSRELRRVVARAAGEEAEAAAERLGLENSILVMHFDERWKQAQEERGKLLQQLEDSVALCTFLRSQLQDAQATHASAPPSAPTSAPVSAPTQPASTLADGSGLKEVLEGVRTELNKLGAEREELRAENARLLAANRQLEDDVRTLRTEKESADAAAEASMEEVKKLQARKASRKTDKQHGRRSLQEGVE